MEKESSENDISANGGIQETLPKEKEDKQEGQGLDLVEPIKEEPSDEKPNIERSESDINSKTENAEEKKEDSDPREEGMETPSENDQEQKNNKESLPKTQSTKPPSNVEKQGDCTLTTTKEKELANEKVLTATTTPQSSPATQPSANRNSVSAASTRSTRSQNPEFLARQRNFLQKVHLASSTKAEDDMSVDEEENSANQGSLSRTSAYAEDSDVTHKRKRERSASNGAMSPANVPGNNSGSNSPALTQQQIKKRRTTRLDSPGVQVPPSCTSPTEVRPITEDKFCWVCHKEFVAINCVTCPRVYHLRCVQLETAPTVDWVCPECVTILRAENFDTRSSAMRLLSLDQLCTLLKFALSRMKSVTGAEPFCRAVDLVEFKLYRNYIAHPMDMTLLERNIKKRMYGSTEAFIADTKWIIHNCIIFNTYQARLSGVAKQILKICKQEMSEIENCPDCYLYAHTRKDSWFIEVCRKPHILVWAKLKGFPFWPAKVMKTNKEGMVDVRFFGAHDRAWVPTRECFLYSKTIPASARHKKRNNLEACIEEVEAHTKKLRDKFGAFEHAPFRTSYDPSKATEQLRLLLPKYNPNDEVGPSAKRARWSGGYASRRSQAIAQDSMKVGEQIAAAMKAGNLIQEESKPVEQVVSREVESSEEDSRQDLSHNLLRKRASRESSVCSEESQESEAEAILKDRKSASLIEWSRFEESAAKLTTGEDGGNEQEDDKQSGSFDNSKKDECSSSSVDLPEMKATEPSTSEKSEEERTAFELETSEVVKKVAEGLTKVAIADKLQEKLLQMEKHLQLEENENEDCETSAQDKKEKMSEHKTDNPINDDVKISAADSISSKQTEGETDPQESGEGEKTTEGNINVASPVSADTGTSETEESAKEVTPKVILFSVNRDEVPEDIDSMSSKKVDESPSLASESVVDGKEGVGSEDCSKKNGSSSSDYNEKKTVEPGINSTDRISETTETENHLASNETEMCLYPSKTERLPSSAEDEQLTAPVEKELESSNQPSIANTETEANSLQDSSKEREKESGTSVADAVVKPAEDVTEESIGLVLKKEREDVDDTAVDGEIDKEVADDNNTVSEKTVSNELPNNTGITDENPNSGANVVTSSAATISENNENEERESEENVALQQSAVLPSASEEKLEQSHGSTDSLSEKPSNEKEASSNTSILDKAIDEQIDASGATEMTETHETDKGSTSQEEVGAELERPIKEEPVDPDDDPAETPTPKTTEHGEDRPLTENRQCDSAAEKENVADKNINPGLEDKERQTSNASPTLSDKDGIFPSLFLDPSITITVVNDKQSEPSEVPTVSKIGNSPSTSEINVNNLRASVNLSKDISLTVVGADYGGHVSSGKEIMGLDMECDHASDHDSCDSPTNNSLTAATSPLSLTVRNSPSSILGQNTTKKTKKKISGPNDSLQARSRARKSFPNKPLPSVKVKSQPELMNGTTGFGNKPNSLLRRNSITGADSRLNSCGPLPHPDIMPPQQHGNQIQGENSTTTADNSNSIIMAPPMLGNSMPQNSTNPLQALRAVNGNIGAPSTHLVNGNSETNISARIIGQQGTSGPRISPASGNNARMPPQLQPRPSGPLLSQHPPPVPSEAGQVTAELNRHSQKISDCVRAAIHDMLRDLSTLGNPQATIKTLQLELERQQWLHKQELAEMKHNADLLVMEMRASMEGESQRIMTETLQRCELEKQRAVEETKKKQWCTNCGKEALFYCCWNTSYCDYPCQQHHWPQHMSSCAQNQPVENREGGDMSQQNSPKQAGRGMSQNKAAAQQQPWFDSSSLYNSATSSSGNTSPLNHQRNNSLSPLSSSSSLVIDEDYDNNNNSNNFETLSQERANVTKKRKRCGECAGCTRVGKCGVCPPCKSVRTHQVCRQRRCSNLLEEGMVRRTGLAQQKQSGKFIGGPPLSYSGPSGPTQMPPQRGRMPNPSQYLGPRGGNMQVSGYSKSATQVTSTASASLTTSTTESAFPTYICNVPRRPTWSRTGSNAASSPEANGISVPTPSSSTTTSYGIQHSSPSLLHMSK